MNNGIITYLDWIICPIYLLVIWIIAYRIQKKRILTNPIYKYFLWGLFAKIIGAIFFCLIYVYYYEGGDTLVYHSSAVAFVHLLFQNPLDFLKVWLHHISVENYSLFNGATGYPTFYFQQYEGFVSRLLVPLELLACNSYIVTSVLVAVVTFSGIWKLYVMFCERYPHLYQQFAFAILFIPSVVFWGSGILKDSWTLAATGWFCFSFYKIFIVRKQIVYYLFLIIVSTWLLIEIKPYIFIALMPGCLIWGIWYRIVVIKNYFLRIVSLPFLLCLGILAGYVIWNMVSSDLGQYSSLDSMIKKAYISSEDLRQDYYQGNSFNIGDYDPTLSGIMSKFPIAVVAGLFRPFIFEAKNMMMVISGIETLFFLGFTLYVILSSPFATIRNIVSNPLVLFCLTFAIFFAFSVAISTSNFGALVRLRIPMIPFYIAGLIIINYYNGRKKYQRS